MVGVSCPEVVSGICGVCKNSDALLGGHPHFGAGGGGRLGAIILADDHGVVGVERLAAAGVIGHRVGVDDVAAITAVDGEAVALFFAKPQPIQGWAAPGQGPDSAKVDAGLDSAG